MSNSEVQAVFVIIVEVIHTHMAQGKSVHITGLGYFRYTLDTASVDSLEAFDFEKQMKTVRVKFGIHPRMREASQRHLPRALMGQRPTEKV